MTPLTPLNVGDGALTRPTMCAVVGCKRDATRSLFEQTRDHDLEIQVWMCRAHFDQWARPKHRV